MFAYRFSPGVETLGVYNAPQFIRSAQPGLPRDDEWIVGLSLKADTRCRIALFVAPMVVITDYDHAFSSCGRRRESRNRTSHRKRFSSARAGDRLHAGRFAARAESPLRTIHRAVTGLTIGGDEADRIPRINSDDEDDLGRLRAAHPQTLAMAIRRRGAMRRVRRSSQHFRSPTSHPHSRIALVATTQPVAVQGDLPPDALPLNFVAGQMRLLVVRDPSGARIAVFDRHIAERLVSDFSSRGGPEKPQVYMRDSDTNSLWTADGHAIEGELKGQRLRPLEVDDELDWDVMRDWYPTLQLATTVEKK